MTDRKRVTRSLGAVLAIDAVGYSRQMARDEEATLQRLQSYRETIAGLVARHGGRVFGIAGDSEIAVLPGALEALACARDIEGAIEELNADLPTGQRMPLRLGIHFGKVLIQGDHVYGDDVNVAARVEGLAGQGGICLSGAAFDRVNGKIACGFEAYGPQKFKNMDRPVRVYRLRDEPLMIGRVVSGRPPRARARRRWATAVAALVALAVAGAGLWTFYLQERIADSQRLAAEHAVATAAAQDRAERLRAALDDAEVRARGERGRAAELVDALRAAERAAETRAGLVAAAARREAGRLAQEAVRAETLIAALAQAEARAEAERQRAQDLLGALHAAEAQASAAQDRAEREETAARAAARQRAGALLASWQAAERQAVAERERVETLLAGLRGAEDQALAERARAEARVAARSQAARARARERAQAEVLLNALAEAERKAAEELRKGEMLMASIEGTEGAPERERVQALLATLEEAGQIAATERKRAELLIASWETPEAEDAGEDMDAARQAAETRAAERARAEALLGLWQDAETTAAAERARAEALLTLLREEEERAQLERAVVPRRKPAQSQAEQAAPEVEALTPAPVVPEDAAAAPKTPGQLAALSGQPEATDAALAESGGKFPVPESEDPSLEAVERLLRGRKSELLDALQANLMQAPVDAGQYLEIRRIWDIQVIGSAAGTYTVKVVVDANDPGNTMATGTVGKAGNSGLGEEIIIALRIDGDDFEIVEQAVPSDEGRRPAPRARATPEPLAAMEAVERLLRAREEAFRRKLRDYNDAHQIEPVQYMLGRSFRLYEMNVLGMANGAYEVRVLFAPVTGKSSTSGTVDVVVFVTIEGDDFEIAGHEDPGSVGRKGTGRKAAARPD